MSTPKILLVTFLSILFVGFGYSILFSMGAEKARKQGVEDANKIWNSKVEFKQTNGLLNLLHIEV